MGTMADKIQNLKNSIGTIQDFKDARQDVKDEVDVLSSDDVSSKRSLKQDVKNQIDPDNLAEKIAFNRSFKSEYREFKKGQKEYFIKEAKDVDDSEYAGKFPKKSEATEALREDFVTDYIRPDGRKVPVKIKEALGEAKSAFETEKSSSNTIKALVLGVRAYVDERSEDRNNKNQVRKIERAFGKGYHAYIQGEKGELRESAKKALEAKYHGKLVKRSQASHYLKTDFVVTHHTDANNKKEERAVKQAFRQGYTTYTKSVKDGFREEAKALVEEKLSDTTLKDFRKANRYGGPFRNNLIQDIKVEIVGPGNPGKKTSRILDRTIRQEIGSYSEPRKETQGNLVRTAGNIANIFGFAAGPMMAPLNMFFYGFGPGAVQSMGVGLVDYLYDPLQPEQIQNLAATNPGGYTSLVLSTVANLLSASFPKSFPWSIPVLGTEVNKQAVEDMILKVAPEAAAVFLMGGLFLPSEVIASHAQGEALTQSTEGRPIDSVIIAGASVVNLAFDSKASAGELSDKVIATTQETQPTSVDLGFGSGEPIETEDDGSVEKSNAFPAALSPYTDLHQANVELGLATIGVATATATNDLIDPNKARAKIGKVLRNIGSRITAPATSLISGLVYKSREKSALEKAGNAKILTEDEGINPEMTQSIIDDAGAETLRSTYAGAFDAGIITLNGEPNTGVAYALSRSVPFVKTGPESANNVYQFKREASASAAVGSMPSLYTSFRGLNGVLAGSTSIDACKTDETSSLQCGLLFSRILLPMGLHAYTGVTGKGLEDIIGQRYEGLAEFWGVDSGSIKYDPKHPNYVPFNDLGSFAMGVGGNLFFKDLLPSVIPGFELAPRLDDAISMLQIGPNGVGLQLPPSLLANTRMAQNWGPVRMGASFQPWGSGQKFQFGLTMGNPTNP